MNQVRETIVFHSPINKDLKMVKIKQNMADKQDMRLVIQIYKRKSPHLSLSNW